MQPALRIARDEGRRLPRKINFTVDMLNTIKPPATGRTLIYDTKTHGLAFRITDKGARAFYFYRRMAGRNSPLKMHLGDFPDITIDQARRLAAEKNWKIINGIDPQAEKQQVRKAETFEQMFARYIEIHAKPKKRTWEEDQDKYDLHLKDWANRKAASITTAEIQTLHARVGKTSPGAANRLLALLSSIFNVCTNKTCNPAKGVARFPEHDRERFIQPDEMPRVFAAIRKLPQTWQDFFTLCLLTGARRGNVLSMMWGEVNFDGAMWTIPAAKFKTNRPMAIPLVPEVVKILRRRQKEQADAAPYVFPSHGKCGHATEPKKPWEQIRKETGLTDLRIHDLRRSMGSWQASTGANLSVISKTLGHRNTTTTSIYARLNMDPVREAMTTATDAMMEAARPKKKRKG